MNKKLPNVFANKKILNNISNNKESYYGKETSNTKNIDKIDDNIRQIIVKKKISDLFNSKNFLYKVNVIITTKEGDKEEVLIAMGKGTVLTIKNEIINISDILDIKTV